MAGMDFGAVRRHYNAFNEYGRVGQYKYAGVFHEEYLRELQGRNGVEVYKEMSDGDDIIGAMLFAIEMLVRQTTFDVEAVGKGEVDQKAASFIKECLDDMQQTWQDTLSEILSFLVYGWSFHEICYKRRNGKKAKKSQSSRYNDGLIGWAKLPVRSQDTLWRWEYDDDDELVGMSQMAPPDFDVRTIPCTKALHFITKSRKWNPEGRSLLRNAYRCWYYKKRFQEIEGIGVERDLAGLPMLQPPEGMNLWDYEDPEMMTMLANAEALVRNVRRDALEGVVVPFGWKFELLGSGSKRQFEIGSIIERLDKRMAMTVMADFILLGSGQVGTFALSSDKTELFGVALGTFLDIICETFNSQGIPALIDLNAEHFKGIEDYPRMVHSDVEKADVDKMGTFIEKMTGIGLLTPDENLEKYVRRMGDLPEMIEGDAEEKQERQAAREKASEGQDRKDGDNDKGEGGGEADDQERMRKAWMELTGDGK